MLNRLKSFFFPYPKENFQEFPFFWLLTVAMVVIYVSSIVASPRLHEPLRLIPFTLLMIIHTAVHWLSPRIAGGKSDSRKVAYLVGQGILAFILSWLVQGVGIILGVYVGLIGETFGILYNQARARAIAVGGYLALSALNYVLMANWRDLVWWAVAMLPMTFFVAIYVTLYTRQADAREQAQALSRKLEAANRQLTDYAGRVEELTRAAERQRMARELHDTLAQGLAGLILQLEAADSHLAGGKTERAQAIVQQAMTRARATLADARRAIDDLREETPATPADLAAAVRAEAGHFTAATGLPCALDLTLPAPLSPAACEQATRAVAEALTNVARHAQAGHVWVHLGGCNIAGQIPGLEIEVRDDGHGFDSTAEAAPGHYGLLGLRERARLAGGTLEITSALRLGTTVRLCLPLAEGPVTPAAGGAAL